MRGSSALHGGHQVAQKSSHTGLPRSDERVTGRPVPTSASSKSGAWAPGLSTVVGAPGLSPPFHTSAAISAPARTRATNRPTNTGARTDGWVFTYTRASLLGND